MDTTLSFTLRSRQLLEIEEVMEVGVSTVCAGASLWTLLLPFESTSPSV